MAGELLVYKNRTNLVSVNLGMDVSADTFTAEIREGKTPTSTLIATWTVTFASDGTDGGLVMRLDDSVLANITQKAGYTDIKRVSGGEPLPVFADPVKVLFKDLPTA